MAKIKPLTPAEVERLHLLRIEYYVSFGNAVFEAYLDDLARLASGITTINTKNVFTFDDYPGAQKKLNDLIRATTAKAVNVLALGIDDSVLRANIKSDTLLNKVFKATKIPKEKLAEYANHNLSAAATRSVKSKLSKRVYKITKQFQRIAEVGIDTGIASGKSARNLATEIKKAVKEPEFSFRRVRNEKGTLKWSKAAKKYAKENPPGTGVYLNPQKNYERLTRTEINMAYRTAEHERTQTFDFVVGIRINLSTNPNHCPFCVSVAGVYPANFLFRGWHPQCRCYKTSIIKTETEMERDNIRILQGKEPLKSSENRVKKPNPGFNKWLKENADRIEKMEKNKTLPYWIQDNFKDGKLVPGRIVGGV